jgi:hypothetical protein
VPPTGIATLSVLNVHLEYFPGIHQAYTFHPAWGKNFEKHSHLPAGIMATDSHCCPKPFHHEGHEEHEEKPKARNVIEHS